MRPEALSERLASGLERKPNGCLEWTRCSNPDGYGSISVVGKMVNTHRVAWTLANGPIPDGFFVLHHCDNPPCCETDPTPGYPEGHLFLGTHADNMADSLAKGRNGFSSRTHCPAGHEYTAANTYVYKRGERYCRTCRECNRVAVARLRANRVSS